MDSRLRNILAFSLGLLILAYIIGTLGPGRIIESVAKTRIELFLLAGLFYLVNEFIASLALKISMGGSLWGVWMAHMRGMLYSNATPGRVGYYYTAFSISKGTSKSTSGNIGIVTLIQGVNFTIKVFLCITALIYISSLLSSNASVSYFLTVSMVPVFIVAAIGLVLYTDALNRVMEGIPLLRRFLVNVELMQKASKEMELKTLAGVVFVALLSWIYMSAQWYLIAHSLGAGIDFVTALLLQPLLTTVMFIPLSPAGLGFTEGGSAVLFSILGLSETSGVTFILLVRFNSILVDSMGLVDKILLNNNPS